MTVGFYGRIYANDAKIPLESFYLWEKRAVAELNRITARDLTQDPDENVKMCICEVAEFLFETAERDGIVSESNDGYSVRYDNADIPEGIYKIAEKWLTGSGLLYRGDLL